MSVDALHDTASTSVLPVLIAITLHEAAHGFVAHRLGDDTAYRRGRVTSQSIKHIDLFGTILMPAVLLLVRSPCCSVHQNTLSRSALRHRRRDMILVTLAGQPPTLHSLLPRRFCSMSLPIFPWRLPVGRAELPQCPRHQCSPGGIRHAAAPAP